MKLRRRHSYDCNKEHVKEHKEYPSSTQGACKEHPSRKQKSGGQPAFMRGNDQLVNADAKTHLLQAIGKIVSYPHLPHVPVLPLAAVR
jgi:hypothetical protein